MFYSAGLNINWAFLLTFPASTPMFAPPSAVSSGFSAFFRFPHISDYLANTQL